MSDLVLKSWGEIDRLAETDPLELRDYCWLVQRRYEDLALKVIEIAERVEKQNNGES